MNQIEKIERYNDFSPTFYWNFESGFVKILKSSKSWATFISPYIVLWMDIINWEIIQTTYKAKQLGI